ncbi:unnamed protein product, partial [Mesorhabditis spiculigera]
MCSCVWPSQIDSKTLQANGGAKRKRDVDSALVQNCDNPVSPTLKCTTNFNALARHRFYDKDLNVIRTVTYCTDEAAAVPLYCQRKDGPENWFILQAEQQASQDLRTHVFKSGLLPYEINKLTVIMETVKFTEDALLYCCDFHVRIQADKEEIYFGRNRVRINGQAEWPSDLQRLTKPLLDKLQPIEAGELDNLCHREDFLGSNVRRGENFCWQDRCRMRNCFYELTEANFLSQMRGASILAFIDFNRLRHKKLISHLDLTGFYLPAEWTYQILESLSGIRARVVWHGSHFVRVLTLFHIHKIPEYDVLLRFQWNGQFPPLPNVEYLTWDITELDALLELYRQTGFPSQVQRLQFEVHQWAETVAFSEPDRVFQDISQKLRVAHFPALKKHVMEAGIDPSCRIKFTELQAYASECLTAQYLRGRNHFLELSIHLSKEMRHYAINLLVVNKSLRKCY